MLSEEKCQVENDLQESNGKIEEFMLNYEQLHNDWKMETQENNAILKQKDNLCIDNENLQRSLKKIRNEATILAEELTKCKKERDECVTLQMDLENKIEEALHTNSKLNMDLDKTVSEKCQLRKELKRLTIKYEHLEIEFKKLQLEKQEVTDNMDANKLFINELETKNKALLEQLKNVQEEKCNISEELKVTTETVFQVKESLKKAINEKQLNEKDRNNVSAKLDQSSMLNAQYLEKLSFAKSDKDALEEKIHKLNGEVDSLSNKCKELTTTVKEITNENNYLLGELENKSKLLLEISPLLSETQTDKLKISKELTKANSYRDNLLIDVDNLEKKLKSVAYDNEILVVENTKLRETLKQTVNDQQQLDQQHKSVKCTLDETISKKRKLEEELKRMAQEHNDVLKQKDIINEKATVFSEKLTKCEIHGDELIRVQSGLEKKIEEALPKNVVLDTDLENANFLYKCQLLETFKLLSSKYKDLEVRYNELQLENQKLARTSNENSLLKDNINRLEKQLKRLSENNFKVENVLQKCVTEKENTFKELKESNQTISELSVSLKSTIQEREHLLQNIKITEEKLIAAGNDVDTIKTEINKMSLELNEYQLNKEQSLAEIQKLKSNIESLISEKNQIEHNLQKIIEEKIAISNFLDLNTDELQKTQQERDDILGALERSNNEVSIIQEEKEKLLNEIEKLNQVKNERTKENNRLITEVDRVKYKRSRDREEFVNLLKKEREEAARERNRVKEVRNEYENKIEKMKEKMRNFYREEISKEMLNVKTEQTTQSMCLVKTIEDLRNDVFDLQQKLLITETERNMLRIKELQSNKHKQSSRESLRSVGTNPKCNIETTQVMKKEISTSVLQHNKYRDAERKTATLPPSNFTQIQETVTISRRTSLSNVPNIEMEDEDDDFNNKYFADFKAGNCVIASNGKESNIRLSELAWRNSMLPPHLKSSYPAETQFVSPSKFREDDLKGSNIELDDSLCKLLPGEKPRQKKDVGTTTYKKPDPPTPSKNGGSLSLQGNEVQPLPLRDQNERTPKKVTPTRIRALFMGKSNIKDNSENQAVTPRTKQRLSIFRKQR